MYNIENDSVAKMLSTTNNKKIKTSVFYLQTNTFMRKIQKKPQVFHYISQSFTAVCFQICVTRKNHFAHEVKYFVITEIKDATRITLMLQIISQHIDLTLSTWSAVIKKQGNY